MPRSVKFCERNYWQKSERSSQNRKSRKAALLCLARWATPEDENPEAFRLKVGFVTVLIWSSGQGYQSLQTRRLKWQFPKLGGVLISVILILGP